MRISELEDIIRRKNTIITRLKKDMLVLEQKVVHLTRLRRPSSSLSVSESRDHPFMMDNIVYDMDSTTSPSSSDSDSPPVKLQDIRGNNVSLADYSGKVLLIVNVASKCGLTQSNYKELNVLYEKYKSQGCCLIHCIHAHGDTFPRCLHPPNDFGQ